MSIFNYVGEVYDGMERSQDRRTKRRSELRREYLEALKYAPEGTSAGDMMKIRDDIFGAGNPFNWESRTSGFDDNWVEKYAVQRQQEDAIQRQQRMTSALQSADGGLEATQNFLTRAASGSADQFQMAIEKQGDVLGSFESGRQILSQIQDPNALTDTYNTYRQRYFTDVIQKNPGVELDMLYTMYPGLKNDENFGGYYHTQKTRSLEREAMNLASNPATSSWFMNPNRARNYLVQQGADPDTISNEAVSLMVEAAQQTVVDRGLGRSQKVAGIENTRANTAATVSGTSRAEALHPYEVTAAQLSNETARIRNEAGRIDVSIAAATAPSKIASAEINLARDRAALKGQELNNSFEESVLGARIKGVNLANELSELNIKLDTVRLDAANIDLKTATINLEALERAANADDVLASIMKDPQLRESFLTEDPAIATQAMDALRQQGMRVNLSPQAYIEYANQVQLNEEVYRHRTRMSDPEYIETLADQSVNEWLDLYTSDTKNRTVTDAAKGAANVIASLGISEDSEEAAVVAGAWRQIASQPWYNTQGALSMGDVQRVFGMVVGQDSYSDMNDLAAQFHDALRGSGLYTEIETIENIRRGTAQAVQGASMAGHEMAVKMSPQALSDELRKITTQAQNGQIKLNMSSNFMWSNEGQRDARIAEIQEDYTEIPQWINTLRAVATARGQNHPQAGRIESTIRTLQSYQSRIREVFAERVPSLLGTVDVPPQAPVSGPGPGLAAPPRAEGRGRMPGTENPRPAPEIFSSKNRFGPQAQ